MYVFQVSILNSVHLIKPTNACQVLEKKLNFIGKHLVVECFPL